MPGTVLDTKYRKVRWVLMQAGAGTKKERSNPKKKIDGAETGYSNMNFLMWLLWRGCEVKNEV